MGFINKTKQMLKSSPGLHSFFANCKAMYKERSSDEIYCAEADDIMVMAYQYYISDFVPKVMDVLNEDKEIIKAVKSNYDLAIKYLEEDENAQSYIGHGWESIISEFRKNLCVDDYHKVMSTYGARSYKNLSIRKKELFIISIYKNVISNVLNQYTALKLKYNLTDIEYKGYTSFFHPHFFYEGNVFNNTLYDLEMRLFLEKRLDSFGVIAEIGAGSGTICRELTKNNNLKYIIFDLPEILTRSHLFLKKYFHGRKSVGGFLDYIENGSSINNLLSKFDILCLPCWLVEQIDLDIDLWINTHSLGEMPLDISKRYIKIIDNNGNFFVSVNDDIDRDIGSFTIYSSSKYLSHISNMSLVHADYPFTSDFPSIKPYYARHLFAR